MQRRTHSPARSARPFVGPARALACAAAAAWTAAPQQALAQTAATPAAAPASAASAPDDRTLESVVVTAQKRSEAVQTVPISMTAIGERKLERLGIESLTDLARQAPGLTVVSSGPGQNVLIVRGVSSTAGTAGTVGYYLDDTPISASSNASLLSARGLIDPTVFDIARVEVLRGPQGTLYGSSSMGGTIKYVTNQPELDVVEGKVATTLSGTHGGGFNRDAKAVVNAPLAEGVAAARVSVFYRYQDGYIDQDRIAPDNYLGIAPDSPEKKNVNTEETAGARLQLRVELPDGWSVTPSVFHQTTRLGAPFQIDAPPGGFDDLIQTRLVGEPSKQDSTLSNLAVHKRSGAFELVSSTSYYDRKVVLNEDTSKVLAAFLGSVQNGAVYPSVMHGEYRNKEFTQELRAVSAFSGPFQLIGGLFFHRVNAPLASVIPVPDGYNAAFGSDFDLIYSGGRQAVLKEKAAFAEAAYEIVPTVTARLGLRAFKVDQSFAQQGDGLFNGGPSSVVSASSDSGVNPKANLSWQVDDDHLLYATASKGYRPGGPNNPAPAAVCGGDLATLGLSESALTKFGSDSLWNYELGAKTAWLGKTLTVNGALFYIDWSKVQQQIVLNCGFNVTANFGKAVSRGGELEVNWRATPQLQLSAATSLTDATLSNDVPGTPAKDGDRLLDVPRWTASASAEYTQPLAGGRSAYGRIDTTYTGGANALYDRTSPYYRRGGYTLANLKVGIEAPGLWSAAVFVDNLFDKVGQTGLPVAISADLADTRRLAITRPRTVGVSLSHAY